MRRALGVLALLIAPAAQAGFGPAESCVRQAAWEAYGNGYYLQQTRVTEVPAGETQHFRVSMRGQMEYVVHGCGAAADLDVMLYDEQGRVVARDEGGGARSVLRFRPEESGPYFLVVHARPQSAAQASAAISYAVLAR